MYNADIERNMNGIWEELSERVLFGKRRIASSSFDKLRTPRNDQTSKDESSFAEAKEDEGGETGNG